MNLLMNFYRLASIALVLSLTACLGDSGGGGGGGGGISYTIGGTVSGLANGASITLLDNGHDSRMVSANGAFTFPGTLTSGATYEVTVGTQPVGATCIVINGTGSVGAANVSNVGVACSSGIFSGSSGNYSLIATDWTWVNGSNTVNAIGVYGTQGVAVASNTPGSRWNSVSWTDPADNLWLFGGSGYASSGGTGALNDLWKFSPSSGLWTWVGGSNTTAATGIYGTQNTAAVGNIPGARAGAVSWADATGNLWLFGGYGYDASGSSGDLSDLWKFSPSAGLWTWVSGSHTVNATGAYGTLGTAAAGNVPGSRYSAVSWTDAVGNLWLFGGYGYDASGNSGDLSDLWKFSPSTGLWTWVSGSNTVNATGVFGTLGTAAAGNVPGSRYSAVSWIDAVGNLWLFGGVNYVSGGSVGELNDLWKFSPSTGLWTWVSGSDFENAAGNYGIQGVTAPGNVPSARDSTVSWIDAAGNLWLFGGNGYDVGGNSGDLSDLWKFSPSTSLWTWVSGPNSINTNSGVVTQGVATPGATPGGRANALSWADAAGNLWLFGGAGYADYNNAGSYGSYFGLLNDMWVYKP